MTTRIGKYIYDETDVTTSWTQVLPLNGQRKFATIVNTSDTNMWLKQSDLVPTGSAGTGIFVASGGFAYVIDGDNLWKGPVWMIHAGVGNKVASTEDGV